MPVQPTTPPQATLLPELLQDPPRVPDLFPSAAEPIAWIPAHEVDLRDFGWPTRGPSQKPTPPPVGAEPPPPRPAEQDQKAALAQALPGHAWRDTLRCLNTLVDLCRKGRLDLQVAEGLHRGPHGTVYTLNLLRQSSKLAQSLKLAVKPTLVVAVVPDRPPTIPEEQPFVPPPYEHIDDRLGLQESLADRMFAPLQDRKAAEKVERLSLSKDTRGPKDPRTLVLLSRPLPESVLRTLVVESTLPPVMESPEAVKLTRSVGRPCLSVTAVRDLDDPHATRLTLGANLLASSNRHRSAKALARLSIAMQVP